MSEPTTTLQLSGGTRPPNPTPRKKTILRETRALNVLHEGKNVTPKPLNPAVCNLVKERQIVSVDETLSTRERSSASLCVQEEAIGAFEDFGKSVIKIKTDVGLSLHGSSQTGLAIFGTDDDLLGEENSIDMSILSTECESYTLNDINKLQIAPIQRSLVLKETLTDFILDLPSCMALKNTEEGNNAERKNEEYEYITVGKGRYRKVLNAETQTNNALRKARSTEIDDVPTRDKEIFTSNWELFVIFCTDSINKPDELSNSRESEVDISLGEPSVDSVNIASDEKQLSNLIKNPVFQDAVCVIERLLANNYFNESQKKFRGLIKQDDLGNTYNLKLLWTFANKITKGRCVTTFEWNPSNEDLLAVGYGKFEFTDNCTGLVLVWNIKNPVQPERTYNFPDPVTTLSFSKDHPNFLAVGFNNGGMVVINIASRATDIVVKNVPTFQTLWSVMWRPNLDLSNTTEQICASYDDGKVIFYTIENGKLQGQQMMRVSKSEGKLKGFKSIRQCSNLNFPVSRYAGANFIRWHPELKHIYMVGTNDGVVYKCSSHYMNHHLDLFSAHYGQINDLQYSPFSKKIFATCGDDWHLRIWAEGISEPLSDLFVTMMSVQAMDWSPTHSTILVSVIGKSIFLWDFQRKTWKPQSETESPTGSRNTVVQFTRNGRCLVVGDIDGNVHVFSLENMPFPAFYQENLLFDSLERSLTNKPIVLAQMKKLHRAAAGYTDTN